ncbi:MAG TPA: aldo/keto reductase [Chloroflexi bacterium]|nr:aldo/keto reductase [Chloroflexota bacterium]
MNYRHLGRSGLLVSPLCLGTMNLGQQASEEDSFVIMDRALECGINFFDTANRYGVGQDRGHIGYTEEIIGNWFAQGEGRRDKVVLATKLYGSMADWPNFGKLSALNIRRACEASLRRLKTDYIDLYQFHHVDRNTSWDEIWGAMERLVQEGKIVYAGSSNFAGWHIVQANEAALGRHFLGLVSEQSLYNLMERTVELEVLPACQAYGVGVIPWSPLAGGLLGGVLDKASHGRRAGEEMQRKVGQNRAKLEEYEGFCQELGEAPSDVALAWLLVQPAVTGPIIGPRTVKQLEGSLRALEIDMTQEIQQRLDGIFPGFGGAAPEAYAW